MRRSIAILTTWTLAGACAGEANESESRDEATGGATSGATLGGTTDATSADADDGETSSLDTTTSVDNDSTDDTTTEGDESSDGSTGSIREPSVIVERITDTNRAYASMHGGWGPHLRSPMQDSAGTLWFAYDGGPDVSSNTTINYARRSDDGTWETVASQAHLPGVQQNAAHLLRGDIIVTYAVNTTSHQLDECYFDTTDYAYAACNVIQIGGPYTTPSASNYVGAALGPSGETIVWFTVVGAAGAPGQFIYTHNHGGGWNGPTVTALPGFNDYSYVRAAFREPSTIAIVGEAYVGDYPAGEYEVAVAEVVFGQTVSLSALAPATPGEVRSSGDIWVDPATGDTHALARIGGDTGYYVRPEGEPWADHLQPVAMLEGTTQSRWVFAGGPLVLLHANADGLQARWADPAGAIDWDAANAIEIAIPTDGFDAPSGIHAAGPEVQTTPSTGLHFAVTGQYSISDHEVWHGEILL